MKKKSEKKEVEIVVPPSMEIVKVESENLEEKPKIDTLDATKFGRADLNEMAAKINEIISSLK